MAALRLRHGDTKNFHPPHGEKISLTSTSSRGLFQRPGAKSGVLSKTPHTMVDLGASFLRPPRAQGCKSPLRTVHEDNRPIARVSQ